LLPAASVGIARQPTAAAERCGMMQNEAPCGDHHLDGSLHRSVRDKVKSASDTATNHAAANTALTVGARTPTVEFDRISRNSSSKIQELLSKTVLAVFIYFLIFTLAYKRRRERWIPWTS